MPFLVTDSAQPPTYDGPPRNCESGASYRLNLKERFGKVVSATYFDPVYGPYLTVTPYQNTGPPLYRQPTGEADERAWPTPNNTVFQYSAGEYVALVPCPPGVNVGQFAIKYP